MPPPEPIRVSLTASICPPLTPDTVVDLMALLDQMMVDKPKTSFAVPTLAELFRQDEEFQEESPRDVPLPPTSLPYGLLVLLPEESNLGLLAHAIVFLEIFSPGTTPRSAAARPSSPFTPATSSQAAKAFDIRLNDQSKGWTIWALAASMHSLVGGSTWSTHNDGHSNRAA